MVENVDSIQKQTKALYNIFFFKQLDINVVAAKIQPLISHMWEELTFN